MRKSILLLTVLAGLAVSCAESDKEAGGSSPGPVTPAGDKYQVGFNAYTDRGLTRAGQSGELKIEKLRKPKDEGGGFGVFAYYTDLKKYDQTYIPNFMYNQGVFDTNGGADGTDALWEYTPVMYWPNESGSDAQSDDEDKVTFFAYAPYVAHASAAAGSIEGEPDWGITGFSRNTAQGDPLVKYIAAFEPSKSVDLCWGVCDQTEWMKIQSGTEYRQTMAKGMPWLNVEHPHGVNQRMAFTFKHALAQLNVQIDADADAVTHDEGQQLDASTKIFVRSISFTGIAMKGSLNLNNTVGGSRPEALWLDYSGLTDLPFGEMVTVKDGRRDGREATSGAEALNEYPTGLNDDIIQKDSETPGVTHTARNLFNSAGLSNSVYVIPTGEQMSVTIVYDVETKSPSLSGTISDGVTPGISVENKITKTVSFGAGNGGLKSGNKYTLKLHLGMNSVKFDAKVSGWDDGEDVSGDQWLPGNLYANAPVGLSLGTSTVTALGSGTRTLTATTQPSTATVTWSNSDPTVATISAPSSTRSGGNEVTGTHTVIITPLHTGTTIITATTEQGSSQCTFTVTDQDTEVVSVSLTSDNLAIYAGETGSATASTQPANKPLAWSSSNGNVATVDPASGQITGVNPGLARITATTASGHTASLNLTVKPTEVKLSQTTATVTMGDNATITATTSPANREVTWLSDNTSVATVTNGGQVHGVKPGTATITASIAGGGKATCFVTVIPSVAQITTYPAALSLTYSGSEQKLVSDGVAEYGTMQYGIGTESTEPESFAAAIPKAAAAGEYWVWYYAKGTDGFEDSDKGKVKVTIAKAAGTISFANANYTQTCGDPNVTQAVTKTGDGTVAYSIQNQGSSATINAATGEVTLGENAGTATITARVEDSANYTYATKSVTYTITISESEASAGTNEVDNWSSSAEAVELQPDKSGI